MTPDEVDILVAALDDCQDLVRKFARLRHPQMDRSYFGEIELLKHLTTAASLLQDYQKLREKVSVEKIAYKLFAEEFPQEPWADWTRKPQGAKQEWFDKAQAIVTYLQQPTEH